MTEKNKRTFVIIALIALAVVICISATAVCMLIREAKLDGLRDDMLSDLALNAGRYDPQSIVLKDTSRTSALELADRVGGSLRITDDGNFAVIYLPEGKTVYDVFSDEELKNKLPEMSPDYQVSVADMEEAIGFVREPKMPDRKLNDTELSFQSYLGYINIGTSWNMTLGSGITVAVIDTGIDTDHPEFSGRISQNSYNASSDKIVKDYGLSVIEDKQGHGTEVAGVISAAMNNGKGVAGIAPEAQLLVIKAECNKEGVFERGSDLVFGLYYAIEQDVNVINMSFGSDENIYEEALQLAADSNIICVASAGNDSTSMLNYPAADENVIGVGALAYDSWELAEYSNYGDNSDVVAPGTVYTTTIGGGYKYINGTSFSSPIVAASLTLYFSSNKRDDVEKIREVLYASCLDLGDLGEDWYYGYGALDLNALVVEPKGKITFEMLTDEIDNIERIYVKGHALQNIPLDIERNYAVFDGWYYGIDCAEGDELDLYADVFESDITLYANWVNEEDGIPYNYVILDDGSVEIRSYTGKRRYLTIPDKIEGRVVSSIGESAFEDQKRIREINLPEGLTSIGIMAFKGCSSLSSINIPDGVRIIGAEAFAECTRMRSVEFGSFSSLESIGIFAFSKSGIIAFDLPKNVISVDGSVFFGAVSLKRINVDAENASFVSVNGVLMNATKDTIVAYPAAAGIDYKLPSHVTRIGKHAFGYAGLKSIDLSHVKIIGESAFSYSLLRTVSLPDSVTSLEKKAFAYAAYLESAKLGSGIVEIANETFSHCTALNDIKFSQNIRSIGNQAFASCGSIEKLDLSKNNELIIIDANAFSGCTAMKSVSFPKNGKLANIGDYAFAYNKNLVNADLPDSVTVIGDYAFKACGFKGSVRLPEMLKDYGPGAYADCSSVTAFDIPASNTEYIAVGGIIHTKDKSVLIAYPAGNDASEYKLSGTVVSVFDSAFGGADKLSRVILPAGLMYIERYAFAGASSLTRIDIPESVVSIGNYAFSGCYSMQSAVFAGNSRLERLSNSSFANSGIKSFIIPANVSSAGQYVFGGCNNLTSVTFAANSKLESIPAYMFRGADNLRVVKFEKGSFLKRISAHGFEGAVALTSLDLTNTSLACIDDYAFRFCSALESIIIPQGVTEIGRYAFNYCKALSDVTLPASIDSIGRNAFLGADNANVYFAGTELPNNLQENWDSGLKGYYTGVTKVATNAKWQYAAVSGGGYSLLDYLGSDKTIDLTNIDIDGDGKKDKIVSIGGYAFADTDVTSVKLPDTVTSIQRGAFANTKQLKSITIPSNIEFIGQQAFMSSGIESLTFASGSKLGNIEQYAFANCEKLKNIRLPDSLEKLGMGAFEKSGLTSVSFGRGLAEIPKNAFYRTKLTSLILPDNLAKVGYYAFAEISSLKSVTFGTKTELMLMGNAFSGCNIEKVNIPNNVIYIGEFCFTDNSNLKSYTVGSANKYYTSSNGILYNKDKSKLIAYPAGLSGSFEVPVHVETIGFGAFEKSKLTNVTFAKGINLLSIGNRAFYGSSLKSVKIPESVVSIDFYAFATCKDLETVIFESDSKLTGIYEGVFLNCLKLKNIVLPDSVAEISDFAFYGCESITQIPIGSDSQLRGYYDYSFAYTGISGDFIVDDAITDIGSYAFRGTDLNSVYISEGNAKELIIGIGAFRDCNNIAEITLPFIGASLDDREIGWLGYIFGAGAYEANSVYIPETLKHVTLLEGITMLGEGAFYGIETVETLDVPKTVDEVYRYCFNWSTIRYKLTDKVKFFLSNGELTKKVDKSYVGTGIYGHLTIPEGVTEIGSFRGCDISSVYLPNTLVKIDNKAFCECYYLKSVEIPESVTSIGFAMFDLCYSLTSVNIPKSVTSIGLSMFRGCRSLTSITIPKSVKSIEDDAFLSCSNLYNIVNNSDLTIEIGSEDHGYIGYYAKCIVDKNGNKHYKSGSNGLVYIDTADGWRFSRVGNEYTLIAYIGNSDTDTLPLDINGNKYTIHTASTPSHLIIPEGITNISNNAFSYSYRLESVSLPNSLESIGQFAFSNCTSLREIEIPDSVKSIGREAFFRCYVLKKVKLSSGLSKIDFSAFLECKSLESIVIPNGVITIEDKAFADCSELKSVTIPNSVESIHSGSFSGCGKFEDINISQNNPSFKLVDGILYNSKLTSIVVVPSKIKSVTIPATVTSFSFAGCQDLESVAFVKGSKLKVFPSNAFKNCVSLKSIEIPEGVTSISMNAFEGCTSLVNVSLPNTVTTLANSVFYGCKSIVSIIIPDSVTSMGNAVFFGCESLENVNIPKNIDKISARTFESCYSLVDLTIPGRVKTIELAAFAGCYSLNNLVLEEGIETIEEEAFWVCNSLTELTIPSSVKFIGENAFENCDNLYKVTNNSRLPVSFGSAESGCLGKYAYSITDASGKTVLKDGHKDFKYIDTSDNWRFMYDNGKYYLLEYNGTSDSAATPKSIEGKSYELMLCRVPDHLIISEGLTELSSRAVQFYGNMTKVTLPSSLKEIGSEPFYSSGFYNNSENWKDGVLISGGHLIDVKEGTKTVELVGTLDRFIKPYSVTKLIWGKNVSYLEIFTNLETLILRDMPNGVITQTPPITLKNVVILGDNSALKNKRSFDFMTGIRIFVEEEKEDCSWDQDFPGWNNGNVVLYGGEWIEVIFKDNDGNVILDEYLSIHEVIIQPYIDKIKMVGNIGYEFIGWDIDGDGKADAIPATSAGNITAVALYKKHVHSGNSHEFGITRTVDPTCTAGGYSFRECNTCGYSERFDYKVKLGHVYEKKKTAAGCISKGGDKYTCENCGDFYFENESPALGHNVTKWNVKKSAFCMTDGLRSGTCSRCKKTVSEDIPATGHTYKLESSTPATCAENGIESYVCSCGHKTVIRTHKATHEYEKVTAEKALLDWLLEKNSAVLYVYEGNKISYYACGNCEDIMLSTPSYVSSVMSSCLHEKTEQIISGGITLTKCSSCSETMSLSYLSGGDDYQHRYESVTVAPTCTEKGYTKHTCSECGKTYTDRYTDPSHNEVRDPGVPATCTSYGLTEGTHCSLCNKKIVEQKKIPAVGHAPGSAATCTADQVCTLCKSVIKPKIGHSYRYLTSSAYNISEEGHACKCDNCDEYDSVAQHKYNADQKCTVCGYNKPHEHSYTKNVTSEAYKAGDATCTNTAFYYKSCDCGAKGTETFGYGEKLAHSFTVAQQNDTEHWYKCANCDEVSELGVHIGGMATCADKAICSVCGIGYGDTLGHDFAGEYYKDARVHAKKCSRCGIVNNSEVHVYGNDDTCDICAWNRMHICGNGKRSAAKPASCAAGTNGIKEYYTCSCGNKYYDAAYTLPVKNDTDLIVVWSHTGGTATCSSLRICSVCMKEYGENDTQNHASGEFVYNNNGSDHSKSYKCCGATAVENEAHSYDEKGGCICGAESISVTVKEDISSAGADSTDTMVSVATPSENGCAGIVSGSSIAILFLGVLFMKKRREECPSLYSE